MKKSNLKSPFFLKYHRLISSLPEFKMPLENYPIAWKKVYFKQYLRFPNYYLPLLKQIPKKNNLFQILSTRRTRRESNKKKLISPDELSWLLYFSAGINYLNKRSQHTRRMYPSGGARYPLELYLIIFKKTCQLKPGIYHYNVKKHSLELIFRKSLFREVKKSLIIINRKIISKNNIFLIITSVFGRSSIKYQELAYKLSLIEAGHLGQNICLVAESLNLTSCPIGSLNEKQIAKLIDLELDKELILYSFILGKN